MRGKNRNSEHTAVIKAIAGLGIFAVSFLILQHAAFSQTKAPVESSSLRRASAVDFEAYALKALDDIHQLQDDNHYDHVEGEHNVAAEKELPLPINNRRGFCSLIPPGLSASHLWSKHAERLVAVTGKGIYKNQSQQPKWIQELMQFLSPRFLRLGFRAPPLPETLQAVLDIIFKRLQDPESNPPLRIAVFGGSVTQGRGSCVDPFTDSNKHQDPPPKKNNCNWVTRIQVFADEFLGKGVVQVVNLAAGGTNTGLAQSVVKYRLYQERSPLFPGPDIVINTYTTNDAFVPNHNTDVTNTTQFSDDRRDLHQQFIRNALRSRPCSPLPLVAYIHDYLGNMHDRILGERANRNVIQELSDWYHTTFISYSDAVQRIVHANDKELAFSAKWENQIDVHFGMPGHVAASWVAAFGALQAVVDHCEDEYKVQESPFAGHHSTEVMNLVERVQPPELTKETRLSTISGEWKAEKERIDQEDRELCEATTDNDVAPVVPCVLAFVANNAGTVSTAGALTNYLKPRIASNDGWVAKDDMSQGGWSNKLGWTAEKPGARVTFFVDNIHTQARFIRIFHLKSYGDIWKGSTVNGQVRSIDSNNNSEVVGEFTLEGFWEDRFSLFVPFTLDLKDKAVQPGNRVELSLDLVGGSSFKITSIIICNHE